MQRRSISGVDATRQGTARALAAATQAALARHAEKPLARGTGVPVGTIKAKKSRGGCLDAVNTLMLAGSDRRFMDDLLAILQLAVSDGRELQERVARVAAADPRLRALAIEVLP